MLILCHTLYVSLQNRLNQSQIYLTTSGQSASLSWYQAAIWDTRPIILSFHGKYFQALFSNQAPYLRRGRICNLSAQLLQGLASSVTLKSKSRRTRGNIFLSHLRPWTHFVIPYDYQSYGRSILSWLHMVLELSTHQAFTIWCTFTNRCLVTDPNNVLCFHADAFTG
jgi:hypothetical protein